MARISFYNAKSNQLLTKKILILIFNTSANLSASIVKTTKLPTSLDEKSYNKRSCIKKRRQIPFLRYNMRNFRSASYGSS
ncbi:hypothetical protein HPY1786_04785 [Helicobacter pylori]|nr:hypothetical protein HPY1786_04785 [Helicobacter pylori]